MKKYIQFRKENEVHVISTLVGLILPALKTKCYSFYEVGTQFIQGHKRANLIEVSADGIIECPIGPTYSNKRVPDQHKCIVVEAKCMYLSTDFPKFPSYSPPFCHVPQVLAEMKAYNAQQLWLVTYTLQSTTLVEVDFDPILWDKIMNLAEKKYGIPKPVVPIRLHEESKSLRPEMMNFIRTHSRLVCEVPIQGQNGNKFAGILHIAILNDINVPQEHTQFPSHVCYVLFDSRQGRAATTENT